MGDGLVQLYYVGQANNFCQPEWFADALFLGSREVLYTIESMVMTGRIPSMKSIFTLIKFIAAMVSKDIVSMMVMGNNVMAKVSQ